MVKLEYTPNDTFLGHLEVRKQSIWSPGGWLGEWILLSANNGTSWPN